LRLAIRRATATAPSALPRGGLVDLCHKFGTVSLAVVRLEFPAAHFGEYRFLKSSDAGRRLSFTIS